MLEAIIAVCWREIGEERTAAAVLATLAPELASAVAEPVDAKSMLQEQLARKGLVIRYDGGKTSGPPHSPTFTVSAVLESDGSVLGTGSGGSKKAAETAAAVEALLSLEKDL
jgi:ribonuclease-3